MKYLSPLVLGVALALLATACQGGRSRNVRVGGGDAAVIDEDGGALQDASDDAFAPDGTVELDAGTDAAMRDATALADSGVPPVDSGTPPTDTGTMPVDSGTTPSTCAPSAGALAIVEVMIASQSGTDQGEWFEIINTGSCTVDLRGLEIGSPATDGTPVTHTVTMGSVAPDAYFVFALSGDPEDNHDLPFDYVYGTGTRSDVFLGNTGDALTIAYGGRELDRIDWGAEDFTRSAALQFPRGSSVSANNDITRWCDATRVYSTRGGTFYGSPGARNDGC